MFQDYEVSTNPADGPKRLELLQGAMREAGLDAFIVPRNDAYRGENVAHCDERLAWLTGFTGSAGFAAITLEHAAIFVDGRYTIQVRDQVDIHAFEPRKHSRRIKLSDYFDRAVAGGSFARL